MILRKRPGWRAALRFLAFGAVVKLVLIAAACLLAADRLHAASL